MPTKQPIKSASDPLSLAIGERIVSLREERDLTTSTLAGLAGMDANYLWRIEAGRQNLSLRNIARLAKALGLSLSELFAGIEIDKVELEPRSYARKARSSS